MQYTKNFTELGKDDAPIAGGKGASLGEMTQAGIPVPGGYVVLADTFDTFLKETDLVQEIDAILHEVNHEVIHTVEKASEDIQGLILSRPMPEVMQTEIQEQFRVLGSQYVAVRSSATAEDGAEHAWAGQLDSFLNTTESDLIEKVHRCWASLFTPRAIFYRFEKGLHTTHISVAVVVQKMVNSEISGIAFSVHPVTEDYNQLIIEAGFGLGEAIVSGSVTPDSYVVEKSPRNILDINVSEQGRAMYRIEGGGSEWKNLEPSLGNSQVLTETQIHELSDIIMRIEKHYAFPCDIEWAFESGVFYIVQSRPITTLSGTPPEDPAEENETSQADSKKTTLLSDQESYTNFGRWISPIIELEVPYNPNPDVLSLDGHFFVRNTGAYPFIKERILSEFHGGQSIYAHAILDVAESLSEQCTARAAAGGTHDTLDGFEQDFALMKRLRFPWWACFALSDAADEMIAAYAHEQKISVDEVSAALPQLSSSITRDQERLLAFKQEIQDKHLPFDLEVIGAKDADLAKRLFLYQRETEYLGTHHFWGEPRLQSVFMESLVKIENDTAHAVSQDYEGVQHVLETAGRGAQLRLECAQSGARLAYAWRPFLTALAEQLGLTYEEIIYLTLEEIKEVYQSGVVDAEMVRARTKKVGLYKTDAGLRVLWNEELEVYLEHFVPKQDVGDVSEIQGNIANKGKAQGRVIIVLTPKDAERVEAGMILVAPETTPDFIPAMGKAAAFVTDRGGITSHAAIVAREMQKPCIIGTKIATQVLKDGDLVEVDADNGVVRIIEKARDSSEDTQRVVLHKTIERDTTFVMQGIFARVIMGENYLGFGGGNPYSPAMIHVATGENIQVLENEKAERWFLDTLLEKNQTDLEFLAEVAVDQQKVLQDIAPYWSKEFLADTREIEQYVQLLERGIANVCLVYYTGMDERSPQRAQDIAMEFRRDDEFFSRNDVFVVESIKARGYDEALAPLVLPEEFAMLPEKRVLEERKKGSILVAGRELFQGTLADFRQQHMDYRFLEEGVAENLQSFTGQIAQKGKVQGRVRIVKNRRQAEEMLPGEVLVSPMTTPDFLPAMKQSVAFVTDEGGIVCHAAIVAREMKKPCIIGTKIATKVLKDGDMVEVDADNGLVRIIKK